MKTAAFLLALLLPFVISQSCSSLDQGRYNCNVKQRGKSEQVVLVVDSTAFTYDAGEDCFVSGVYAIDSDNLIFSLVPGSLTNDLSCMVDSNSSSSAISWENCDFNSKCDRFDCEAQDSENNTIQYSCDLEEASNASYKESTNSASPLFVAASLTALLQFVIL